MGDLRRKNPLSIRVWSSSAHPCTQGARECKPVPKRVCTPAPVGQDRAQLGTNPGPTGSKRVANEDRCGSQTRTAKVRAWLAVFALGLAFWALTLGSLFAVGAFAKCRTHRCWHRVHTARAERWQWRQYRSHPMPYCTWAYESGTPHSGYGQYARSRYRVLNLTGSGAGGKFQIMYRTWLAFGGKPYGNARYAPPLEQERIARRVLAGQGIHAWSRC